MLVTFLFVLYILVVFLYLFYKWQVDFSWKDIRVGWKTRFWPSFGFVLGQVLLIVITLSVYWPAAYKNLYRYFTARTVLSRGETEIGHLGFEGQKGSACSGARRCSRSSRWASMPPGPTPRSAAG